MEEDILRLMRASRGHSFSVKEISKAVDRHQFRQDANWARPLLHRLVGKGSVQKDQDGRYFVPADENNTSG
jgi:hypothetical protein